MKLRTVLGIAMIGALLSGCGGGQGGSADTASASAAANYHRGVYGPAISSLAPTGVTAGSGTFVLTVNGSRFVSSSTVNWNGTALTTTYVSESQLTASVSAAQIADAGSVSVTVTDPSWRKITSNAATFDISGANPIPAVTSLKPAAVTAAGPGFTLTVNGSGFVSSSKVHWNGTEVSANFVNDAQITASVPATAIATAGTASVTVSSPTPGGGTSAASPIVVTSANPVPTVSSLAPASATAGGASFTLTVDGSNFVSASTVNWNGAALSTTYVSPTQLSAAVPASDLAAAGSTSITVSSPTPGGGTSGGSTFTINSANPVPAISSLAPASTAAGGAAFKVTVGGSGFVASSTVKWNGTALSTTYVSDASLTASVPASGIASSGSASVTVASPAPGGGTSSGSTFTVTSANPLPAISSLAPTSASAGSAAFKMTVDGSNFLSTSTVNWNGTALPTAYVSASQLIASVPASDIASAGSESITVANPAPGGGTSAAVPFTASTSTGTVPGAPTNVTVTPWPYTGLISFTPPANSGASPITSYTVTAVGASWIHGTGPGSPIMVQGDPLGNNTFTVTATNAQGTGPASAASNAATSTGGTSNLVYSNGVFYWEGDYSLGHAVYADTTGDPVGGPFDVMFVSPGNGYWQPWAPGMSIDLSGYNYLNVDLKPTIANKEWGVVCFKVGDVQIGTAISLPADANGTYGPTPQVGVWATYKIPLKTLGVGPGTAYTSIYKFFLGDTGANQSTPNTWYANNIYFSAN